MFPTKLFVHAKPTLKSKLLILIAPLAIFVKSKVEQKNLFPLNSPFCSVFAKSISRPDLSGLTINLKVKHQQDLFYTC